MHNRSLQPLLHRKPMPPHRGLLHKLMPKPVAMPVARLPLLLPRLLRLVPTWSTALAPVRHPMPSTSLAKDTHWRRGNGMPPRPEPTRQHVHHAHGPLARVWVSSGV
jgi:hypothetical protein